MNSVTFDWYHILCATMDFMTGSQVFSPSSQRQTELGRQLQPLPLPVSFSLSFGWGMRNFYWQQQDLCHYLTGFGIPISVSFLPSSFQVAAGMKWLQNYIVV